jgi:steroid 5-alpha reductase family enzyme
METEFLRLFAFGLVFAAGLMLATWVLAWRVNNLSIVDAVWSFGFLPLAAGFAWLGSGDPVRRATVAVLVAVWSVRLGLHLAVRIRSHHPVEDVRYVHLRAKWGKAVKMQSLIFFGFQALILALLAAIFIVPCLDSRPGLGGREIAGIVLWLVALVGESVADRQLQTFRANPAHRGQVCRAGLWNYSRHPNYFFEWLVWVAYFLLAWPSPGGCFTVLAPGVMLFFLLRVTGIPLTEQMSLQSKGDAYREYQRTTSAFVPWFPKRTAPTPR